MKIPSVKQLHKALFRQQSITSTKHFHAACTFPSADPCTGFSKFFNTLPEKSNKDEGVSIHETDENKLIKESKTSPLRVEKARNQFSARLRQVVALHKKSRKFQNIAMKYKILFEVLFL